MALCEPCRQLGFDVVAHYNAVPASQSTDFKAKPAECYYHHFKMPLPAHIQEALKARNAQGEPRTAPSVINTGPQAPSPAQPQSTSALKPAPAREAVSPAATQVKRAQESSPSGTVAAPSPADFPKSGPQPPSAAKTKIRVKGAAADESGDHAHPAPRPVTWPQSKHARGAAEKPAAAPFNSTKPKGTLTMKCRHPQCGTTLRSDNKSGVCGDHYFWGKKNPVDGQPTPKSLKASPPRKSAAKPLTPLIRGTRAVLGISEATANICVPEAALDNFWRNLTVQEKADLFVRQLQGD